MQDHGDSKSNRSISYMPGRALQALGAICFASAAFATPALAGPSSTGAVSRENASTELHGRRSGDPALGTVSAGTTVAYVLPGDGGGPSCRVDVRSSKVAGG